MGYECFSSEPGIFKIRIKFISEVLCDIIDNELTLTEE